MRLELTWLVYEKYISVIIHEKPRARRGAVNKIYWCM